MVWDGVWLQLELVLLVVEGVEGGRVVGVGTVFGIYEGGEGLGRGMRWELEVEPK